MIFHGSPQSKAYRLQRYGFTLSEVMIAMVLLSIITQAVFSFYSIGISTYKRSSINAEIVASVRYLKKLVEEKISFKSNNNFNVFMKKDGFSDIPGFKNIMVENLEESNQPLYTALGFGGYLTHSSKNIEECTQELIIKKTAAFGHIYNGDFAGNYIAEITKEVGAASGMVFSFAASEPPARLLGASFCDSLDSVKVSSSVNPAVTAEINTSSLMDISFLTAGATPGGVDMQILANKQNANLSPLFTLFASFDSKSVPVFTPQNNMSGQDAKFYFVTGTNLYCNDGMMFYEQDTSDLFINHAFYVHVPDTEEAELDGDGNVLKEIRYAFARQADGWKFVDDTMISNVENITFAYFDKGGTEIPCDKNYWQWRKGDEIYSVNIDVTTKKDDTRENFKMIIEL